MAHPDKYSNTYGSGPRVADQGWRLQSGGPMGRLIGHSWRTKYGSPSVVDLEWRHTMADLANVGPPLGMPQADLQWRTLSG